MNLLDFFRESDVNFREHGDHHHTSEGWVSADCFQCSPNSGHFRLGFNLTSLAASCWSCGRVSSLTALQELTGKDKSQCLAFLKNRDGQFLAKKARGRLKMPRGTGPLQDVHKRYLKSRNFDP